ncbi:MAG: hypothetical protein KIS94_03165 [Chitinophagales bacterium]|nr:hypothetical protein [Chitinophagales bacterium]
MKNYKVNMNREPLTAADVKAGKDFGNLLKTYQAVKTPFFKTAKFWFGASAVVVAGVAGVLLYNYMAGADMPAAPTSFIQPPVAEVNINATNFIINTASDTVVTYKTGSHIYIPANAFLNENGNVVTGEIELSYREFHDIADVFIAGIPMVYDSAGEEYHFETAGMMEIIARQNGKELFANPGALIKVEMVSHNTEDKFNTYCLDTTKRTWEYVAQNNYNKPTVAKKEKQEAKKSAKQIEKEKELKTAIAAIEQTKPVEPRKVDEQKPRFTIKVDKNEFPEIAIYENMKFQVEDKNYNTAKAKVLWENVELKRVAGTLNYEVTFSNARESYTVIATPVFADKDYAAAKKVYDEKYKEYETALAKKKAEQEKLKAEMEVKAKEIEQKIQQQMKEQQERIRTYEAGLAQSDLMYRTFTVARFGIWNCDYPQSLPEGGNVLARFENKDTGKSLDLHMVYLVERGRNAMYTYYPDRLKAFRFNPQKENFVWLVTRDMKIAVVRADDFRASVKKTGDVTFKAEVVEQKFKTSEEVKEYLEI